MPEAAEELREQITRIKALDAISPLCKWEDPGIAEIAEIARELYEHLLAECDKWETKMGY